MWHGGRLEGMRVLVTGAAGFIGGHLVARLVSEGCVVTGWSRVADDSPAEHRLLDLADRAAVAAAFAATRFDATVHLAGNWAATLADAVADATLTAIVVEHGALTGRSGHLVCFGSADQYGAAPAPQTPLTPTEPLNAYGLGKNLGDLVIRFGAETAPVPISTLRPFSVYGPGQPSRMFLGALAESIRTGSEFRMSAGSQIRDFVHVFDVCSAVAALLADESAAGRTYNVGTGVGIALVDAAARLAAGVDAGILVIRGETVAPSAPPALVADISETTAHLGWVPTIDLMEGFETMLHPTQDEVGS